MADIEKVTTPKVKPEVEAPVKKMPTRRYHYGTGRRKTAVARVRLYEKGHGLVTVNDQESTPNPFYLTPFTLVGEEGKWDISAKVVGGGKQSQLEAIRLGIARALLSLNADFRQALKKASYLRRDPREKERMKPGLKRARKAPQFSKR